MKVKIQIPNNLTIDSLTFLLNKYNQFQSALREIKINSITDKRCELSINDMSHAITGCIGKDDNFATLLKKASFTIKSMDIIIGKNSNLESLNCEIRILETEEGKILNELIKSNSVVFKPNIYPDDKIINFYAEITPRWVDIEESPLENISN